MVDAIMSFVVGKMGDYIIEESSMLMGVKDELEELNTELTCIQGYLKDVEAREREDEASKVWTNLVLDIAYDLEDLLDSYNLKVEERSRQGGFWRLTNKIGENMDAYNILDDIKNLKRKILDVTRKRETYGSGNINEPQRGGNISSLRVRQLRRTRSVDHEELVVGLEDDAKILLEKLLDDRENKRFVISIYGMGGLGKTALARKLYNSADVKSRFEYRAWTYASQEYNTKDMLMRIIRSLKLATAEELEKINEYAEEQLEVYLHNLLEGKRYMVVVDDIWEREAWDSLKRALPCNHEGSRVMITTHIRDVAEGVDERVFPHELRFLTFKESWQLFEQKAFKNMQWVDEDLQKTGQQMVQKCGGLPLAIVVLAGLLSRKRVNEWHDVCSSLQRRLMDNSIHVFTVFDLSFKEMKQELKLCFLYLSVFPKEYEINVEELIRLLVAEGFIQHDDEMMMEDMARSYIEELIDRSLVRAERIERGKVMSCRIHDLLRDVVIKKAKELNFVNVYNDQHSSTTCRREVVYHLINGCVCDRRVNKQMRSLLFFGEEIGMSLGDFETFTLKLKFLRVLNLGGLKFLCEGIYSLSLPDVIGKLIHLRYLGIANTDLLNLPHFISNMRLLQTLDAGDRGILCFYSTTDLSKLTSLRHVIGPFVGDLLIGDAVNLQTLRSISSDSWSKLKHELLVNLRDLEIFDDLLVDQRRVPLDLVSFSKLKNLRVLKLRIEKFNLEWEEAFRFQVLVELTLHCDIKKLPNDMDLIFPSLESFRFLGSRLEEDPMHALQKLPRLEDMVLKNCYSSGEKLSICGQGFGRLRKLELIYVSLDELQIEEEAMPSLVELKLDLMLCMDYGQTTKLMIPDRLVALVKVIGLVDMVY